MPEDAKLPSGPSPGCPSVSDCRTVSTCPLSESGLCESVRVALSLVDKPHDYQRQRLLDIGTIVHPLRDKLADPVERSAHGGNSLRAVGAVKLNETQHHASPWL